MKANNWRFHRTRQATPVISWQGGGGDISNTSIRIDDGQWHHFVGTSGVAEGRALYIDGVQAVSTGSVVPLIPTNAPLAIGGNSEVPGREWAGEIDDVSIWNRALTAEEVTTIFEAGSRGQSLGDLFFPSENAPATFEFSVRRLGGTLEFSWESERGLEYSLVSDVPTSLDELRPREVWPVYETYSAIPATLPHNSLTIPLPPEPERYFAIRGDPAPPVVILEEDFESVPGGWSVVNDPGATATTWELGPPDPSLGGGPTTAHGGVFCFGTDLDARYLVNTSTRLRSPPIDTTEIAAGVLEYWRFVDIEAAFDGGSVRLLDAGDLSEIAVLEEGIDGSTFEWENASLDLPPAAIGRSIIVEFVFQSDGFGNFTGFYVDDIRVESRTP